MALHHGQSTLMSTYSLFLLLVAQKVVPSASVVLSVALTLGWGRVSVVGAVYLVIFCRRIPDRGSPIEVVPFLPPPPSFLPPVPSLPFYPPFQSFLMRLGQRLLLPPPIPPPTHPPLQSQT